MTTLRVVDTETRGLAPDNQIVEVATVDLLGEEMEIGLLQRRVVWTRGRMWSSLVNPGAPIPVEAMAVHHITDEMVAAAPPWAEVGADLFADAIPVAYNARFDREAMVASGVLPPSSPWLCAYKAAVKLWPDAPSHKNQVLRYWLRLKLADPAMASPHRALGDAYVTAALSRQIANRLTIEEWTLISSNPVLLPRLHFGEHAGKPLDDVPKSYLEWIVHKSKGSWDEDVIYTAKFYLDADRARQRSRSPV